MTMSPAAGPTSSGAPRVGPRTPWADRGRRLVRAVGAGVALGLPVLALGLAVRSESSPLVLLDHRLIDTATDLTRADDTLRAALVVWQEAFQARWVNLAGTVVCVVVWRRYGLRTRALWAFATLMAAWVAANVVKELVQRARPVIEDAVEHAPGFSFPSGHAANAASAATALTVLVWPLLGPRARVAVPVLAGALVLLTAADRVLLGVHFPSDVVAGMAFGVAFAGAAYVGYLHGGREQPTRPAAPPPVPTPPPGGPR